MGYGDETLSKTRLYVANLSYQAVDRDIMEIFQEHGTVKEAKVMFDRDTEKSRGFAFVEMNSPAEAERALAADGETVFGRKITVTYARERNRR